MQMNAKKNNATQVHHMNLSVLGDEQIRTSGFFSKFCLNWWQIFTISTSACLLNFALIIITLKLLYNWKAAVCLCFHGHIDTQPLSNCKVS